MASILKVDQLQKPDGSTPTAADLGIDVAGSVVQVQSYVSSGGLTQWSSTSFTDVIVASFTVQNEGSLVVISGSLPFYTNGTATAWSGAAYIDLVRDGGGQVAGFEHSGTRNDVAEFSSNNGIHYAENLPAGTYTYRLRIALTSAGGHLEYNRSTYSAPSYARMSIFEIAQ